ncbi:MAG: CehA/McbA family metallohydrolase [Peptoniphilaceae bacterium]|nr:CehA/McbA family metallohydrolase [Peptoniphilaceae bacterium]MDY6018185.1 CehA/McbA family metallohydrolase [Anaerococcus sp.]
MEKIFNIKIGKNGFGRFQFPINDNTSSLSFKLSGDLSFISLMIYDGLNKLVGQIVTNKNVERNLSRDICYSSPGFKRLKNYGNFTVEYIYFSKDKKPLLFEVYKDINLSQKINDFPIGEDKILSIDKRWYGGDFHTHTIFSDGKMTRVNNNKKAIEEGLDFFSPTDHNFNHFSWPKNSPLIIAGTEITSVFGHVNVFFENESIFEKFSLKSLLDEESFLKVVNSLSNKVFSINHPFMAEWKFTLGDFKLKNLKFMEIINDPTYSDSKLATKLALKAWNILLNNGYLVYGLGGSDSHLLPYEKYEGSILPSLIGDPRTYVYSNELSLKGIKENMLKGNISVSRGKLIEVKNEGDTFLLKFFDKEFLGKKLIANWILDGKVIKKDLNLNSKLKLDLNQAYHWLRVDIIDSDDDLFAFTNPYFFNLEKVSHKIFTWKELCEEVYND